MCFKELRAFSSLNSKPLKLVDQFIYLGSNIASTRSDVNIHVDKAWNAIGRLTIIWKSDVSNKIKWEFFQAVTVSVLMYGCFTWTLTNRLEKKTRGELHKDTACCFEIVLEAVL